MRKSFSRMAIIFGVVVLLIGVLFWNKQRMSEPDWVEVGVGGPEKWADFPYRLITLKDLPQTHSDLVALTMALQSHRDRGAWAYIPAFHCYAPDVRDGVPSVQCDTLNGSNVFVGGDDNVREVLLSLRSAGKVAAIRGKVLGLYAATPVIWVNDPALKRKAD